MKPRFLFLVGLLLLAIAAAAWLLVPQDEGKNPGTATSVAIAEQGDNLIGTPTDETHDSSNPSSAQVNVEELDSARLSKQQMEDITRQFTIVARDSADLPVEGSFVHVVTDFSVAMPQDELIDVDCLLQACTKQLVRTDRAGQAVIDRWAGREFLVVLRHPLWAPAFKWIRADDSSQSCGVTLGKPRIPHGRALDRATGRAVPDAHVVCFARPRADGANDDIRSVLDRVLVGSSTNTDADGAFCLGPLADETSFLFCSAAGYSPLRLLVLRIEDREILIQMLGPHPVEGIVVDREGDPIANAQVGIGVRGQQPVTSLKTTSDAEGHFGFDNAPDGPCNVNAFATGFAVQKLFFGEDGPPKFVEIVMQPEVELKGRVIDDTGATVPAGAVSVSDLQFSGQVGYTDVEDDGTWYMSWVGADRPLQIEGIKAGYSIGLLEDVRAPQVDLEIVMRRMGCIVGVVRNAAGEPVKSFAVRSVPILAEASLEDFYRPYRDWREYSPSDGCFVLEDCEAFPTELSVTAPGFVPCVRNDIVVPPGEQTAPIEIVLLRGREIFGRIVEEGGAPIEGATVALMEPSFSGQDRAEAARTAVASGLDGSFMLPGAPPGSFTLSIASPRHGRRLLLDQRAEDYPRDLVLRSPGALAGDVDVPWPSPDSVILLKIVPEGTAAAQQVRPDRFGLFEVAPLAPGRYFIEMIDEWGGTERNSMAAVREWVEIEPGRTTTVSLSGRSRCTVQGTVRTSGTVSPEETCVRLLTLPERNIAARTWVGRSGFYRLHGLKPGTYELQLGGRDLGVALDVRRPVSLVEATDGAAQIVDFEVAGGGVQGIVWDEFGTPLDAQVVLREAATGASCAAARTRADGTYQLLALQSRSSVVQIVSAGFADSWDDKSLREPATVEEGVRLEHRLTPESRLFVRVVDDLGRALYGASVTAECENRPAALRAMTVRTDAGPALFARLGAGFVTLSAALRGYAPSTPRRVWIGSGARESVELALVRLGAIDVEVTDADGAPRRSLAVECVSKSSSGPLDSARLIATTDSRGHASFEDMLPGIYLVSLEQGPPSEVTVLPGERAFAKLVTPGS